VVSSGGVCVCVSAVDIGNKPILISHEKSGRQIRKKIARSRLQIGGTQEKKKILQSEKGEKNKGESRGRCVHVCRAHQSSYLL
jgi:hypothetical protein